MDGAAGGQLQRSGSQPQNPGVPHILHWSSDRNSYCPFRVDSHRSLKPRKSVVPTISEEQGHGREYHHHCDYQTFRHYADRHREGMRGIQIAVSPILSVNRIFHQSPKGCSRLGDPCVPDVMAFWREGALTQHTGTAT